MTGERLGRGGSAAPGSDGRPTLAQRRASVLHALAIRVLRLLARGRGGARRPADLDRLVLVIHTAFGMGGTIRATITQANQAARAGKHVTLVSVTRAAHQPQPFFALDDRVDVRILDDPLRPPARFGVRRLASAVPSVLFHPDETRAARMTLWRDLVLVRELRRHRDGVVVGTRAGLNVAVAYACRGSVVRIGQEHVPFASYPSQLLDELALAYRELHGLMVLTEGDARAAEALLTSAPTVVRVVPNALPDGRRATADGDDPVIVTAGRLSRGKRQDLLIRAFARIADRHPDWEVRIYGEGPRRRRLEQLIVRLHLEDRVRLMGASDQLGVELSRASIFVLSSDMEAFGIALIEAMRARLAVISTACEHGPPEIITDGVDGLLVPPGDPEALARALDRVVDQPELRRSLAAAGLRTSTRYEVDAVAERWRAAYEAADQVRTGRSRTAEQEVTRG